MRHGGGLLVKVCGVRDPATAKAALAAGADRLGLVLAPSVRRVLPEEARRLARAVAARWVGVFVDPSLEEAVRACEELDLAAVQLHGSESPDFCRRVGEETGREVWKALAWTGDPASTSDYAGAADVLVLDRAANGRAGGTGLPLPWEEIADRFPRSARPLPLVLAGGLDPDNVAGAIEIADPDGVDASSGLESSPGVKDAERIRAFATAARASALRSAR